MHFFSIKIIKVGEKLDLCWRVVIQIQPVCMNSSTPVYGIIIYYIYIKAEF
jgi:hypothetical protein